MSTIAYQGIVGSYNEIAAHRLAQNKALPDPQYLPAVSSRGVIDALQKGQAEYGVLAFKNSTAGEVAETRDALHGLAYEFLEETSLKIEHRLFSRVELDPAKITAVCSHPQALRQCMGKLARVCPQATRHEERDTALAAERLSKEEYDDTTAVLCSQSAGDSRALRLVVPEAMNDLPDNRTTFHLIRLAGPPRQGTGRTLLGKAARITWDWLGADMAVRLLQVLVGVVIFAYSYAAAAWFNMKGGDWATATFVAVPISWVLLKLIQGYMHALLSAYRFGGHWEYHLSKDHDDHTPLNQEPELQRMVLIERQGNSLHLRGWKIRLTEAEPLFYTKFVLVSDLLLNKGVLTYWYRNHDKVPQGGEFDGVVNLEWSCLYPFVRVNYLRGWFGGRRTKELGAMRFRRITESHFKSVVGTGDDW